MSVAMDFPVVWIMKELLLQELSQLCCEGKERMNLSPNVNMYFIASSGVHVQGGCRYLGEKQYSKENTVIYWFHEFDV